MHVFTGAFKNSNLCGGCYKKSIAVTPFSIVWKITTEKSLLGSEIICPKSSFRQEVNILLLQIMIWSPVPVLSCFLSGQPSNPLGSSLSHYSGCFWQASKRLVFLKFLNTVAVKQKNWVSEIRYPSFVETSFAGNMLHWGSEAERIWIGDLGGSVS